jgi:UDP-2,3-diacylglucosamine hydrolase
MIAVVADAHIGGPGGPPGPLLAQLERLPAQGCVHLVLLGDLFQAWIGLPQFETPATRHVVEALAELRRQGVRVDYVEGNRDFFLGEGRYQRAFDTVSLEATFVAEGVRYLAVHGDGLDEGDTKYRLWRRVSKSAPTRWLMRGLPAPLARRMVASTERRLAQTNFEHKVRIPHRVIEIYAARRISEGHDVVLLGHFHEPRSWPVAGGEVRLLEAWFRSRRVERF